MQLAPYGSGTVFSYIYIKLYEKLFENFVFLMSAHQNTKNFELKRDKKFYKVSTCIIM